MVDDFCLWVFCFKIPIIQETKKRRKLTPENRRECEIATCFNLVSLMFKPFQKNLHILEKTSGRKTKKMFSLDLPTVQRSISGKVMETVSFKFWILMDDPPGFKKPSQIFLTMSSPLPQTLSDLRLRRVAVLSHGFNGDGETSDPTDGGINQYNQYTIHTVDGSEIPNNHLGCINLVRNEINYISTGIMPPKKWAENPKLPTCFFFILGHPDAPVNWDAPS